MRFLLRGAVALAILFAVYWGWALAGAGRLASAASQGDVDAVTERVDLQALIRSLSSQIARAYLDENPQLGKRLSGAQGSGGGLVVNAAGAEMLLRAFLTPENIAAFLGHGVSGLKTGGADAGTLWRLPALGEAFSARPLQTFLNSRFDGPLSFVVGLDSPDGQFGVHMNLSGLTWRLSALDIPESVTAKVANQIAQRINGTIDAGSR